jgi:hypothetical protein
MLGQPGAGAHLALGTLLPSLRALRLVGNARENASKRTELRPRVLRALTTATFVLAQRAGTGLALEDGRPRATTGGSTSVVGPTTPGESTTTGASKRQPTHDTTRGPAYQRAS